MSITAQIRAASRNLFRKTTTDEDLDAELCERKRPAYVYGDRNASSSCGVGGLQSTRSSRHARRPYGRAWLRVKVEL